MSNIFSGLNIGLKALQTQKKSLDVTGHNVANANNEDYSRQRAVHSATKPFTPGGNVAGQVGTGVEVAEIQRIRDQFIDGQIREETQGQGKWSQIQQGFNRIESIFNEPSDSGLSSAFNQFWDSLQDLSNNPEDTAVRTTVRQRAKSLISTFHNLEDQLTDYKRSLNKDVNTTINNINSLGDRIADLNKQIKRIEVSGDNANDLLDKRNGLLKELNQKINVNSHINDNNQMMLTISGSTFVNGDNVNKLSINNEEAPQFEDKVEFAEAGVEVNVTSGELEGIMQVRDEHIDNYKDRLDTLAENFINEFNKQHRAGYGLEQTDQVESTRAITDPDAELNLEGTFKINVDGVQAGSDINISADDSLSDIQGYIDSITGINSTLETHDSSEHYLEINSDTGGKLTLENANPVDSNQDDIIKELGIGAGNDFFAGESAQEIGLSSDITESSGINNIAAASASYSMPGDGTNAVNLSDKIKIDEIINGSSATDYLESMISDLGVEGQRASQMESNQEVVVNQLENHQKSISGVSLDEEMSNMVKYQQSYRAASRIISTTNQMIDSLMNIVR